jgi:hypothetical protein
MADENAPAEVAGPAVTGDHARFVGQDAPPGCTTNVGPFAEDEVTEWLRADGLPPAAGSHSGVRPSPVAAAGSADRPRAATTPAGRLGTRLLAWPMIAVLAAALLGVALVRYVAHSPGGPPAGHTQNQAAAAEQAASWVARQVSPDAGVACDPVMCAALRARGFPARDLLVLGPRSQNPVGSDVVVETPAVLSLFGSSLATAWAPAVLASFGSGPGAITVRVMASNGAAAYQTLLGIDLADRKSAGAALLNNPQITAPAAARAQLTAGAVDSRLLLALAALAGHQPVSIVRFGDAGPGASPGVPLRSADLAEDVPAARLAPAAYAKSARAYLSTVNSRFRPASMTATDLAGGHAVLRVEFTAPSPLGMYSAKSSSGG